MGLQVEKRPAQLGGATRRHVFGPRAARGHADKKGLGSSVSWNGGDAVPRLRWGRGEAWGAQMQDRRSAGSEQPKPGDGKDERSSGDGLQSVRGRTSRRAPLKPFLWTVRTNAERRKRWKHWRTAHRRPRVRSVGQRRGRPAAERRQGEGSRRGGASESRRRGGDAGSSNRSQRSSRGGGKVGRDATGATRNRHPPGNGSREKPRAGGRRGVSPEPTKATGGSKPRALRWRRGGERAGPCGLAPPQRALSGRR